MLTDRQRNDVEERFLQALRRHLKGLGDKVIADFGQASYEKELAELKGDPIYPKFAFDTPEYVLIRFMGRVSISIGRRLGEIYDKIPRFVAAARFGLTQQDVAPKLKNLELDIGLPFAKLQQSDIEHVKKVVMQFANAEPTGNGVGIEIRYNFNPNDSARLRKDVDMATYLQAAGLFPIYLIFSAISPRDEAIARLTRAGWRFIVGEQAVEFARTLFGLDLASILDQPKVKDEVAQEVGLIMKAMVTSHAFQEAIKRHHE